MDIEMEYKEKIDYEKSYKKLVEDFDAVLNLNTVKKSGVVSTDDIRKLIPELQKSEDEKMKEIITKALCTNEAQEAIEKCGINAIDCVSWIENCFGPNEWKPSKEQMDVLQGALGYVPNRMMGTLIELRDGLNGKYKIW